MAIIKCSECGRDVSDKAISCPMCGNPIRASESKLIVYGVQIHALIGKTSKLYLDGVYAGKVKKFETIEIPIEKDCVLTATCEGIKAKNVCNIKAGEVTKVQLYFQMFTVGGFYLQKVDTITNGIMN